MGYQPVGDLLKPSQAVGRLAGPGQFMVLSLETADAGLHALPLESREMLQSFRERSAVIFRRLDEQSRRHRILHILERGPVPEQFDRLGIERDAVLIGRIIGVVRIVEVGYSVGDGTLGCCCLEAVGMGDDPVGHVAAK